MSASLADRPPPQRERLAFTQFAIKYEHDCIHSLLFVQLFRVLKDKETVKVQRYTTFISYRNHSIDHSPYIANGLLYTDDRTTFILQFKVYTCLL